MPISHPTIVQQPGAGEAFQKAFAPLIQALQERRRAQLEQDQLLIQRGRLAIDQEQAALEQSKFKEDLRRNQARLDMLSQQGAAIKLALEQGTQPQMQTQQAPAQGATDAGPISAAPIPQAPEVQMLRKLALNSPDATVTEALPQIVNAAGVIQRASESARKAADDATQRAAEAADLQRIEKTRGPEFAAAYHGMLTAARSGAPLSASQVQQFWPAMRGEEAVDPARAAAAMRFGVASGLPWGSVRRLFELKPTQGIADNFVFPVTFKSMLGGSGLQTDRRLTASLHLAAMNNALGLLDGTAADPASGKLAVPGLVGKTGGLSFLGQIDRTLLTTQSTSGGTMGGFASLMEILVHQALPADQRALINAQFMWANSYRYLVSGQQTSDKELVTILSTVAEAWGDDPALKAQKSAFRHIMTDAARRLAGGASSPVAEAQKMLQQLDAMTAMPAAQKAELRAVLQTQLRAAQAFQARGGVSTLQDQPVPDYLAGTLDANSPQTPDAISQMIDRALDQSQARQNIIGSTMGNP